MVERYQGRFEERILTPTERDRAAQFKDATPHIAGRFAAKEAILKALGTGWRGNISWQDMEIVNDTSGMPVVSLTGECAAVAKKKGIQQILLSITHTEHYASASAIALGA